MIVLSNKTVWFDVDDTLVMWQRSSISDDRTIEFEADWGKEYLIPHRDHIEQLKNFAIRGHKVIVWSCGGWQWAEVVVKTLNLEKYVTIVCNKPDWIYDDLPASSWMPDNKYIPFNGEENE